VSLNVLAPKAQPHDSTVGEDNILSCQSCGSAANQEMATSAPRRDPSALPISAADTKTQLYEMSSQMQDSQVTLDEKKPPGVLWAVIVPEDRQISDVFVQRAVSSSSEGKGTARILDTERPSLLEGELQEAFRNVELLIDEECAGVDQEELAQAVADKISSILGAPHDGTQNSESAPSLHDFFPPQSALRNDPNDPFRHESSVNYTMNTFRQTEDGDMCSTCAKEGKASRLSASKSIEVGHTFLLGTKYSEALQAGFTPADPKLATMGSKAPFQMGCYGIGVSRILGAIAQRAAALGKNEQLIWPRSIAPFKVCVVTSSKEDAEQQATLRGVLQTLTSGDRGELASFIGEGSPLAASDIVIDDRDMSISRKLRDADIVGYSVVIVLGKSLKEKGMAEVIVRDVPDGEGSVRRDMKLIAIK
jgi:prolyl-tRNA synthetase